MADARDTGCWSVVSKGRSVLVSARRRASKTKARAYGRRQAALGLIPATLITAGLPFEALAKGTDLEEISKLLKYARLEGDPEVAIDYLDAAVERAQGRPELQNIFASSLLARANALLLSKSWGDAKLDFGRAISVISESPEDARNPLELALAYDGLGIAEMKTGNWVAAQDNFERGLGTVGQNALSDVEVPGSTPYR